jgi:hypothetical protein
MRRLAAVAITSGALVGGLATTVAPEHVKSSETTTGHRLWFARVLGCLGPSRTSEIASARGSEPSL